MAKFYLSRSINQFGEHIVHTDSCPLLPAVDSRIDLGVHLSCEEAVEVARTKKAIVNGCLDCCILCYSQRVTEMHH